jgi:hypothetical protein
MQLNVGKEIAAMEEMPVAPLRNRYAEVFKRPCGETEGTHCDNRLSRCWV